MRRILITVAFLFLGSLLVRAQINVGSSSAPDASSILQLSSSNQGLRLPQVSLTSTTTFGLAGSSGTATNGMQVYNTNASITSTNAVYPVSPGGAGIYTWDGTGWRANPAHGMMVVHANVTSAITRGGAGNTTAFISTNCDLVTEINTISGASINTSTGSITVPAGTYMMTVTYSIKLPNAGTTNPELHSFFFDFPADTYGLRDANSTRLETAQPVYTTANAYFGFSMSYMPVLANAHSFTFGFGWGQTNLNLPATCSYIGTAFINIIRLQ